MDIIINLSGYLLTEQLYTGSRTSVYRGVRESDQQPVVIKLLRNEYPSFHELVQFRNQYTIAKNLHSSLFIQTYSLEPYHNGYALVMEDMGGTSLKEWKVQETQQSLQEFLEIAITLCNALDVLYHNRIIHKDIKPANILINSETKQVKLIDFSIASLLPRETQTLISPNILEGTLAYLSPEQTGRMNRGIDYRSDFYSLGVTFYELLTGQLPFIFDDPMKLVHCHLAKEPILVHQIKPELPLILSQIVSKLMAKNAENRYQSALGLKHDLEICLAQLQETGNIETFALGTRDITDRFLIPERLYGRETEVDNLLAAFERVSQGSTEMMLVAGFSGIGKTVVVNEVHKPIVRQRGYFIKGKYDQFQRNIPFSAFVQAFRDLMGQLLSESDTQLQIWKTKILSIVGDNGQVLIEVIPELERIIGVQPTAPELSGSAAQNRFNLLMQKFVQVFTTVEHPLVMFLDDLQWADSASLKLLQLLIQDTGYLLVLGAYRDNEVSPVHPFMLTVDEIVKARATVNTITLQPLSLADMNQLVANTLNCDRSLAQPLTELVYQKTKGNPFFATQFLKALHDDELITFDWDIRHWQCDIAQVRALAITDDVVEFMALQLQKLPRQTQEVLKLAACIGAQFDLATLAIVSEKSPEETAADLWKALQEGLLIPTTEVYKFFTQSDDIANVNQAAANASYRFLHDRVQQATYSLIPDDQKQATHLKIGRLLLQNFSEVESGEELFDIINHLNLSSELITQQEERTKLAKISLSAGQKAKLSTAYESGAKYLAFGLNYLPSNKWEGDYDLTLALYIESIEIEFLVGNFDQAENLVEIGFSNAKSSLDRAKIVAIQLTHYQNKGLYQKAIQVGLEGLKLLGLELSILSNEAELETMALAVKKTLNQRAVAGLIDAPLIVDEERQMLIKLLMNMVPPTYLTNQELLVLVVLHMTHLCLQYGNTNVAGFVYVWYGTILCQRFQDYELGYEFGLLGVKVNEKFNNTTLNGKIYMSFGNFINHWRKHVSSNLVLQQAAYQRAMEVGDFSWCHHSALFSFWQQAIVSSDIHSLLARHEKYISFAEQTEITTAFALILQCKLLENLQGLTTSKYSLSSETFNEESALATFNEIGYGYGSSTYYFAKAFLFFTYSEYAKADEMLVAAAEFSNTLYGQFQPVLHCFYKSLTVLQIYGGAAEKQPQDYQEIVQKNRQQLQIWADNSPENCLSKFLLLEAEIARVAGEKWQAAELYDRAIALAKENQFLNEEALANELAAKFYLGCSKEKVAQVYMTSAYYCYARWGAKAKVDDLEKRYPQLLAPILQQSRSSPSLKETITQRTIASTHSSGSASEALDLATLLKAFQAISGEIELDKLLITLLKIVITNAGADKCVLLFKQNTELQVVALIEEGEEPKLLPSMPLESSQDVAISLVNTVKRNLKPLVIVDARVNPYFASDPYIEQHQPKSILCSPILNQGKLIGILYLENNLTVGAFTSDRVEVLNLICSQAAISLENARLYQESQQAFTDLKQAQLKIVQSEKMSALGNLIAGVAHEINNPVGFLNGNITPALDYINDLFGLLDLYQQKYPQPDPDIQEEIKTIELDYIREDLPRLVGSMREGVERIKDISTSLRTFSRADSDRPVAYNLHEGIDSTLLILKHRLKADSNRPEIQVIKNYGDLPQVECFAGQLNQVFMNLLANAIDALEEANQGRSYTEIANQITIKTELSDDQKQVIIQIKDNGIGIDKEVQEKIFDDLFTTKGVGKGTGLGLAIARQIIEEKHLGKIVVNSEVGRGTEFMIQLPM